MAEDVNEVIQAEATTAVNLQQEIEVALKMLKEKQDYINQTWKNVEQQMIENDIKSIKGEWGSLTIAERISFDYDKTELPKKFYKVVVDDKKVADTYKLEGKVKGATPKWKKYLTKRIK